MKIVYHHRTQGKGAEGVHIREIIKSWREMGHEVFVVSPPGIDVFEDERQTNEVHKWKLVSHLWRIVGRFSPQIVFEVIEIFYNFSAQDKIRKVLVKEKIDFIYERYSFYCWAGVKSGKEMGIPLILEVNEISGIKRVRGQTLKGVAKKIEINNFKQACAIVVVSKFLKKEIARTGITSAKIHVIPNGVNPKVFNPDVVCTELIEKYKLRDKVVIGFAGGFVKWQDFDLLFNAFKKVIHQTDREICLFLVGDGPMRKVLKQKVKALDLQNSVIFTERVPHGLVPVYIKAMDICVIIHNNEFGSPIKLFEYMAMCKSVIAPRLGPLEEVVTHNVNGCLFEKGNLEQLTEFLKELTINKEFYRIISQNARQIVLKKYLWEHNAKSILNVYNDLGMKN